MSRLWPIAFILAVTVVPWGSAALAQTDADVCAALLPGLEKLAADAVAFRDATINALPNHLETMEPSPAAEAAAQDMASALPPPIVGAVSDYALAVIRLRSPLETYARETERALAAMRLCATSAP